jgi:hypothetical protein
MGKLESEKTRVYAQKPSTKMPFKNSISVSSHAIDDHIQHNALEALNVILQPSYVFNELYSSFFIFFYSASF